MRTVYTTLPIYDSTDKQEYNRTGNRRPMYCPRHQLPPFQFETGDDLASIDEVLLVDKDGVETDITAYFETLPELIDLTNDYIQYKGDTLNTQLPLGSYYLQMTSDNDEVFYSEWICVIDIYPNLITSLANSGGSGYDTFTVSGVIISSAITDGTHESFAGSGMAFDVVKGEVITVIFNETLTSGVAPTIRLRKDTMTGTSISNGVVSADGLNEIALTATETAPAYLSLKNENGDASNFSTNDVQVIREYSENYIKLQFTNTKDLPTPVNEPTILYQDSFIDMMWFKRKLNAPEHDTTLIGTEKDGVYIAEKLIAVYKYKIVDWIGRTLYRCLHRLSLHDDIAIIDTVGNQYDVGHDATVDPVEWEYWEVGKLVIRFNDGGSVFEGNAANMT